MSNAKQISAPVATVAPVEAPGALSASQVAEMAGAAPKDFRRWMRAQARLAGAGEALPGKGGRYAYTTAQAEAIVKAYGTSKARKGTSAPAAAILAALAPTE